MNLLAGSGTTETGPRKEIKKTEKMRRFSFNIDLRKKGSSSRKKSKQRSSRPPLSADGYEMSDTLSEQRQNMREWPRFQHLLEQLPEMVEPLDEWDDPHQAAEYIRVYEVTRKKILKSAPGFSQEGKTETHCFFSTDGTKHLVSRLLERPNNRINEMRLLQTGQVIRLYYENSEGPEQSLEDLFEKGLLGLEEDVARFARYPNYIMRFFILTPHEVYLESTFRGVCFYDGERGEIVTEEARSLAD